MTIFKKCWENIAKLVCVFPSCKQQFCGNIVKSGLIIKQVKNIQNKLCGR